MTDQLRVVQATYRPHY